MEATTILTRRAERSPRHIHGAFFDAKAGSGRYRRALPRPRERRLPLPASPCKQGEEPCPANA